MSFKKRKYDEFHLQNGFTSIVVNYEERPQCMVSYNNNKGFINDSMSPAKLKQHLHNLHPHSKDKEKYFVFLISSSSDSNCGYFIR